MRTMYIITILIYMLFCYAAAVLIPIYITPGYYWWTAFFLINSMATSYTFSAHVDKYLR